MNRILIPIAWLYRGLLELRHKLYDWHILHTETFEFPVICIGNLSLGGTGKTPHTEYLINLLSNDYGVAVVSRGYGRKTKGFLWADTSSTAQSLGDEPMLLHTNHPQALVAVDADRNQAIHKLALLNPPPQVYLLDDAFQHRSTTAGLNLLLTEYGKLYTEDYLFPAGTLRDARSAAKRAQIVIVTKCPENLPKGTQEQLRKILKLLDHQQLFLSHIHYDPLKPLNIPAERLQNKLQTAGNTQHKVGAVCFTGIAHPKPLFKHLSDEGFEVIQMQFPDHHTYEEKDIQQIIQRYEDLPLEDKIIITTEKDYARLNFSSYLCQFESIPLFAAPISMRFHEEEKFNEEILSYVRKNSQHR